MKIILPEPDLGFGLPSGFIIHGQTSAVLQFCEERSSFAHYVARNNDRRTSKTVHCELRRSDWNISFRNVNDMTTYKNWFVLLVDQGYFYGLFNGTTQGLLPRFDNIKASAASRRYMVECSAGLIDKELLVVVRGTATASPFFEVYGLDWNKFKWTKVESLGQKLAVFLCQNDSRLVWAHDLRECKSNCIYFVDNSKGTDFGVLDMTTNTIQPFLQCSIQQMV